MKNILFVLFAAITLLCTGCSNSPKSTANDFMKSMVKHDYDKAAACCGFSKDKNSKEMVITVLLEQFGSDMRSFTVTKDSILPDKERAIVTMDVSYNNNLKEEGFTLHLKKMDEQWVVDPFTVDE